MTYQEIQKKLINDLRKKQDLEAKEESSAKKNRGHSADKNRKSRKSLDDDSLEFRSRVKLNEQDLDDELYQAD